MGVCLGEVTESKYLSEKECMCCLDHFHSIDSSTETIDLLMWVTDHDASFCLGLQDMCHSCKHSARHIINNSVGSRFCFFVFLSSRDYVSYFLVLSWAIFVFRDYVVFGFVYSVLVKRLAVTASPNWPVLYWWTTYSITRQVLTVTVHNTHNHFTALWTLSGTTWVSWYQKVHFAIFWIFWCKMKITQVDTPTIRMDCHPIQTNWCPHLCHPHHFLCQMPFLTQPYQFILAWDRHQICWLAYPVAWQCINERG